MTWTIFLYFIVHRLWSLAIFTLILTIILTFPRWWSKAVLWIRDILVWIRIQGSVRTTELRIRILILEALKQRILRIRIRTQIHHTGVKCNKKVPNDKKMFLKIAHEGCFAQLNISGGSPFVFWTPDSWLVNVIVCVGLVRCFSGGVVGGNRGWRNETPAGSKTEVSVSSEAESKKNMGYRTLCRSRPQSTPKSTTTHLPCQSRP